MTLDSTKTFFEVTMENKNFSSKWSTPKRLKVIIRVEGGHYTGSSRNSYEGRWWRTLVVSTGLSRAATIALGADESSGAGQQCGGARGVCGEGGSSACDSAPPPVLLNTHVSASRKYVLSATCSSSTLYILPTKHNDFIYITIQIKYLVHHFYYQTYIKGSANFNKF